MSEESKVKNCPFCGSHKISYGYKGQPATAWFFYCCDCRAQGPEVLDSSACPLKLDEHWNNRTSV